MGVLVQQVKYFKSVDQKKSKLKHYQKQKNKEYIVNIIDIDIVPIDLVYTSLTILTTISFILDGMKFEIILKKTS